MKKILEGYENAVKNAANKVVGVWNWTTGRTKGDLAKGFLASGYFGASFGVGMVEPGLLIGLVPLSSFLYLNARDDINKIERLEQYASQSEARSILAEYKKQEFKLSGHGNMFASGIFGLLYSIIPSEKDASLASLLQTVSYAVLAAGDYVMLADNFPPRKNCVKRGLEKLCEIVDDLKQRAPVPSPVSANYFDYYTNMGKK